MKKLLILIAFLAQLYVEAQTYVPFPTAQDSAVWNISVYYKEGFCRDYDLYINGDTVINNTNYVVLGYRGNYYQWYSTGIGSGYCEFTAHPFINRKQLAYREDSTHKIFLRSIYSAENDTTETLLFDFAMQVGDSLKGRYAYMGGNGLIPTVSSIDSVFIDNNWRRRLNFKNDFGGQEGCFYLIEGIGSNFGLLHGQYCPTFEGSANLNCFKVNGSVKYPPAGQACSDFSFITSTPETPIEDYKIQLYPNPSNGQFNLTFETTKAKDVSLTVVDLTGRHIWGENVSQLNGKYNRTFGTNNMASGVYMLTITIDGQRSVRKLVVN